VTIPTEATEEERLRAEIQRAYLRLGLYSGLVESQEVLMAAYRLGRLATPRVNGALSRIREIRSQLAGDPPTQDVLLRDTVSVLDDIRDYLADIASEQESTKDWRVKAEELRVSLERILKTAGGVAW
jgi:hypothetical protein